jgi:hypothetical protein
MPELRLAGAYGRGTGAAILSKPHPSSRDTISCIAPLVLPKMSHSAFNYGIIVSLGAGSDDGGVTEP